MPANGSKNLIPLNRRSKEERIAIARKGGQAKSPAKTLANQLIGIKRMNPENIRKKAMLLASDPNASSLEIMRLIETMLKKEGLDDRTKVDLIRLLISGHTAIHGAKTFNKNIGLIKVEFSPKKEEQVIELVAEDGLKGTIKGQVVEDGREES